MAFNPNDFNKDFDKLFGAGSFESGLNSARNAGRLKAQAGFAKQDYLAALKLKEKEAKAAKKKAEKKTYDDAVTHFSDPFNKEEIKKVGAAKLIDNIKNDPAQQEMIKAQGFNVEDYLDGITNAASDGKFRSQREYNQYKKNLLGETKREDKAFKDKNGMSKQEYYDLIIKPQQDAKKKSLTPKIKKKKGKPNLWDDTKADFKMVGQMFNPFDGVSWNEAKKIRKNTTSTKLTDEFKRGEQRLADSAFLGIPSNAEKKMTGKTPDYLSERKWGEGKGTDMFTSGLGYLVPGGAGYKALNASKAGKALTQMGKAGLGERLASEATKGAIIGAGFGGAEVGVREGINPNDYNAQQNMDHVVLNTAMGMIADPALYGLGKSIMSIVKRAKPSAEVPTQELLGLPAPQLRLNEPQMQLPAPKPVEPTLNTLNRAGAMPDGLQNPIPTLPKPMSEAMTKQSLEGQGVNFGQGSRFTPKARPLSPIEGKQNPAYWQNRYEDFTKFVQDNGYTPNNLNHDAIQELWTHFAKYDEPFTIDQVVDMAYPKGFEAPPPPKAEVPSPPQEPTIKDYLNQDPRIKEQIKGFFPPARPEPKVSRLATLDEMVSNLESITPPKQTPVEPSPLEFRRDKGFNPDLVPNIKNRSNGQQPTPKGWSKKDIKNTPVMGGKSNLLLPLNPTVLKTVKTSKSVNMMSKEELQGIYKQLEEQHTSLSSSGKSKKQLAAVKEDMKKVNDLLMKLDLQTFGEKAPKEPLIPKSKAGSTKINPAPKGSNADITNPNPVDEHGYGLTDTQALSTGTVKTLQKTKDILPNQTLTKNIYELADRLPKEIGNRIKTTLDTVKSNHVNNLEQRSTDLYDKVVKGLGINKGSKESALVQDFGEKTLAKDYLKKQGVDPEKISKEELDTINIQQLKEKRPNDWKKIVKADKYFRDNYKKTIDEVNATVKQIYPNNPDKIVPERSDYYHHFNELEGFEGFKNLIQNSAAIDPHLAGISPNTKPNSKWQAFKQMRGNGEYKSDAVGGYLKYLQAASHSTHIDPMIKVLRQSADQIATATEGTKNLNNIKTALEVHADNLAGKTNPVDRLFQDHFIGRKAMQVVNVINGHIKKNMILGNLGSALGQIGSTPLAIGKAKQFAPHGLMDTLGYTANHLLGGGEKNLSAPISKSQFLKERFSGKYFTRFDNRLLKKPEKMAAWLLETADKAGTYFTWNSMYRKGLALSEKAVKNSKPAIDPIKFADAETRHIIAGRGVGEVPIVQRAKITQLVVPFSLEVGNQWKVLGKQMNEKDFAGVITFLAASYGLNEVMTSLKGSGVSYNPVGAVKEGYNKTDGTTIDKVKGSGASLLGETVGNIPGGNYLPQILGLASPKTKQALFGDRSPDRFGTGVGVASTVFKPATDLIGGRGVEQAAKDTLPLVLPFGGNQAKKTISGIESLAKGGSYTNKGELQYPVDSNSKSDLLHSILLGPTTTAQGQDYYKNNGKPLSTKQTMQYQNAPNKQEFYNSLMFKREVTAIKKKMKDVQKDQSLTPQEKQKNILVLMQELQKLQK